MRTALAAFVAIAVAALLAVGCGSLTGFLPSAAAESADITLPPGFQISVYAGDVPNARQMAAGPDGIVFVGHVAFEELGPEGRANALRLRHVLDANGHAQQGR